MAEPEEGYSDKASNPGEYVCGTLDRWAFKHSSSTALSATFDRVLTAIVITCNNLVPMVIRLPCLTLYSPESTPLLALFNVYSVLYSNWVILRLRHGLHYPNSLKAQLHGVG